jgi:hypothetical protein
LEPPIAALRHVVYHARHHNANKTSGQADYTANELP